MNTAQLVYIADTKVIAFIDNITPGRPYVVITCQGQERYDTVLKECVSRQQCLSASRFLSGPLCVPECLTN